MSAPTIPPIVCNQPDDLSEVKVLDAFRLHVRFHDGIEGEVDLSARVRSPNAGVFAQLWPGEIDLAPNAMYTEIKKHGKWTLS